MTDKVPPSRPLPAAIGRYRITSRLGKGAMGVVYGAHDEVMDRNVAVKVMMADLEDDPETSARFYREARAAGQLVHRNIITIFDMGEDDGRPFIVMELLEGDTLGDFLKKTDTCEVERKIDLMVQICEGLRAAHARGIYHRDVKPGNLVVRPDGCLKILDFGIARIASSSMTASGLIMGTPDYMSPEQAVGKEIDQRSDIFSAGAVFYFMVTGRKPFAASGLPAVFHKVTSEDPLPIRDAEAPPELARVIEKALAKRAEDRYQHCSEIIADLTRVRRHLTAQTTSGVTSLLPRIREIETLVGERTDAADRLRMAHDAADSAAAWQQFRQRHAWVAQALSGTLPADGVRSGQVDEARKELELLHQQLSAEVSTLREIDRALSEGRRALATNQPRAALAHLDRAARLAKGSPEIEAEAEQCRVIVAERTAAEDRARVILADAKQASATGRWDQAIALCDEALRVHSDLPEARSVRDDAAARQQAAKREREAAAARALEQASAFSKKGLFGEAAAALDVARKATPDSPAVVTVEHAIEEARLEAARISERDRHAADAVAAARRIFTEGRRDEAVSALAAFLQQEPKAVAVQEAIERLRQEAQRLEHLERRKAEAADHAMAAESAFERGDAAQALARANQALMLEPSEARAVRIQAVATAQLKSAAEKKTRLESAARLLEEARTQLARNKFSKARSLVQQADALVPGHAETAALVKQIDGQEAQVARDEERARLARQRAKAAAPALEMAHEAERHEDFVRAAWLAENALALDEANLDARDLLQRARARLEAQPTLADETVDLVRGDGRAADPEDTVNIGRAEPAWRRVAQAIRHWSGGDGSTRPSRDGGDVRPRDKERF